MISYRLRCANGHSFEGWFKGSTAYEDQAQAGTLACPICDSRDVEKDVMAPAVARGRGAKSAMKPVERLAAMVHMARAMRTHVEQNFENVGDRFAQEARAIHLGEAEARGIWGQASSEEAKALVEDGVQVAPLPEVPKIDG